MGSNGKKKTTMAKLNRESKLRERRQDKQARKDARKQAAVDHPGGMIEVGDPPELDEAAPPEADQPAVDASATLTNA